MKLPRKAESMVSSIREFITYLKRPVWMQKLDSMLSQISKSAEGVRAQVVCLIKEKNAGWYKKPL